MGLQAVCRRIALGFVNEVVEEPTGRAHLTVLSAVSELHLEHKGNRTFTTDHFEHRCVLCDSYVSQSVSV